MAYPRRHVVDVLFSVRPGTRPEFQDDFFSGKTIRRVKHQYCLDALRLPRDEIRYLRYQKLSKNFYCILSRSVVPNTVF